MNYYIDLLSIQTPKHLRTGLEHRTKFDCGDFSVYIFETFQSSTKVQIQYEGLSISSMIRGSKVVHAKDGNNFEFLPGASLILPEGETIYADFPGADKKTPAQCATIIIAHDTIRQQLLALNKNYNSDNLEWKLDLTTLHFNNNSGLARAFNELIQLATQNNKNYPLSDLMLKSFLVRIIEAQNEHKQETNDATINNQLFLIKSFIKENIGKSIKTEELMEIGNCSKSTLYRLFEAYCNKSPGEYILHQKMSKARNLLLNPELNISDVAYMIGFTSVSYFIKQFKAFQNCTPGDYIKKFAV